MPATRRRTVSARRTRRQVFRHPSLTPFNLVARRRRALLNTQTYNVYSKSATDTVSFAISEGVTNLQAADKSASDTITFAISESPTATKIRPKTASDTVTFAISESSVKDNIGPLTGTFLAPPLAVPVGPILGSRIVWTQSTPAVGSSVLIETSTDNGATWQTATSGDSIPHLPIGVDSVRAILTRITLTRANMNDLSPTVSRIELDVDVNQTITEDIPLGVFTLNETNITDSSDSALEVEIAGNDLSHKISRNQWDAVKIIPKDTNFGDAIKQIVSDRLPGTVFNFASTDEVTPRLTFGAQGENDPWSDILDMAEAIGMEIFFDARGVCTMRPEPDPEIQPAVWAFSDAANPVMTDVARRITDEDTANYIIVTGENTTNDTAPARAIAVDTDESSPTYYQGPFGVVTYRVTSPLVKTDAQALTMAQAILTRRKGATEIVEIDCVPMCAVEPSDIVFVQRDTVKLATRVLVDSTSIPLGVDETMHLVTRRQKLAESRPPGGGVGGLPGGSDDGGSETPITPDEFTVVFGACINASDAPVLSTAAALNPDWFVNLGDTWYKDGQSPNWVSDWTAKFNATHYKALIDSLPDPSHHVVAWSDHDFGYANNSTGLGNPSRSIAANAAYRTKFPSVDYANPDIGIYRTWTVGRIRFILLDMLTFKSKLSDPDNGNKTMLGTEQKKWLAPLLASNEYPLIVIFGDGQLPGPKEAGQDEWRGYDSERRALAGAVSASPATVLYCNGDTHSLAAGHDQFGFARCWQAAPFYNLTKVKAKGEGYLVTYPTNANEGQLGQHFGHIKFTDTGSQITAKFSACTTSSVVFTDSITINAAGSGTGGGSGGGGGPSSPVANPAQRLRIGNTSGWNRVNLGVGVRNGSHVDISPQQLAAGFQAPGYFELTPDGQRVRMYAWADGGTTPGSSYPRTEFREFNLDNSSHAAWDPDVGDHALVCLGRVTSLEPGKPELVVAQTHDGSDDTAQLRIEGNDIVCTINGSTVHTVTNGFTSFTQDYAWGIGVHGTGSASSISFYWNTGTALGSPIYTSGSTGRSSGWYFKAGAYGQSNESTASNVNIPFIVELSRLAIAHTGYPPSVGLY